MAIIARTTDKVMNVNINYQDMTRPVAGPEDPFNKKRNKGMNTLSGKLSSLCRLLEGDSYVVIGHVEEQAMDDYSFLIQQRTFDVHGYALNPSITTLDKPLVGSLNQAYENGYTTADLVRPTKAQKKEMKRKRGQTGDLSVVDGEASYKGPWAEWEGDKDVDPVVEEEAEEWREEKKRREEAAAEAKEKMKVAREEKSIFHGELITSYRTDKKGRNCWTTLDGPICTFQRIPMSSSTPQMELNLRMLIYQNPVYIHG